MVYYHDLKLEGSDGGRFSNIFAGLISSYFKLKKDESLSLIQSWLEYSTNPIDLIKSLKQYDQSQKIKKEFSSKANVYSSD